MRRVLISFCLVFGWVIAIQAADRPLNVLFIVVDDLRPTLGCFGDAQAKTPRIDRLAKRGTTFLNAYCQQAVCSPSRLSVLTGKRPDTIRVWDLGTHFREAVPEAVTLPQFFKERGYHTRSIGKIFHGWGIPAKDAPSWSESPILDTTRDPRGRYATAENLAGTGLKRASYEWADVADGVYVDGQVCAESLDALESLRKKESPFFLAVGFRKPHLPFCAPKQYWDLYERESISLPHSMATPQGAPELATRSWRELSGYTDIPKDEVLDEAKVRLLRHGYYACVSYIDALVGRLLDRLDALGLRDDTVVCFWGDHGFHLGEQGIWAKANNFELSTRVPLILSVPGQARSGATTQGIVELVDLYPTLADVCGLPKPAGVEGVSFAPLQAHPASPWKRAAFSQYPRKRTGSRHTGRGDIMGYALRTERFRYVEWIDGETHQAVARELYDHSTDAHEMRNVVTEPGYADAVRRLAKQLEAGWTAALPQGF